MTIDRITHDPAVMGGKPCIRGMRVTVGTIIGLLSTGKSRERILEAYPYLEPADIDAALAYAALNSLTDNTALSVSPEEVDELARRAADDRRNWPTTQEVIARLEARAAS